MPSNEQPPITDLDEKILLHLQQHPEFFSQHASFLAQVQLYSPHGNRIVGLQERQAELLRDKIKWLERRLMEMIRNGSENELIIEKIQRWSLSLLSTRSPQDIPAQIVRELQEQFAISQVALRLWSLKEAAVPREFTQNVSENARYFAESLEVCYCGANADYEVCQWLGEPEKAVSIALLPLRLRTADASCFGLLVLSSPDSQRFHADMGTDYLERIAAVASAALSCLT